MENKSKFCEAEKARQVLLDAVDNWSAKKHEKDMIYKLAPEGKEIPLASKLFNLCQDLANGIGELSQGKLMDQLQKENAELKEIKQAIVLVGVLFPKRIFVIFGWKDEVPL